MERKRDRTTEVDGGAVGAFYQWLVPSLGRVIKDKDAQKALSVNLAKFSPSIRWEVGPYDDERSFFAFSPNLDPDLLPLTEALANSAPAVQGWVFLAARPRKRWHSRSIRMTSNNGTSARYELDNWLYYLTSFKNGEFFDVNLVPFGTEASKPELQRLGELLVQSELGERIFIEFVDRVNIVSPEKLKHYGNKIDHLHDQLVQQLSEHTRQ
jgi:hypothetical protein